MSFLAATMLTIVNLLFYLAFTLMPGTPFAKRGLVAGVALGFMFAGSLLRSVLPWMTQITPWMFADLAVAVAQGQVYPASVYGPVIGTTIVAGAFMGVALWQFSREEF